MHKKWICDDYLFHLYVVCISLSPCLFVCVCESVLKKTCLCNGSDDFICSLPWIVQHFYHYLGVRAFFQDVNLFFDSLSSTYFFLIFQIIRLILHHWSSHKWIDRWMRRTMHNICYTLKCYNSWQTTKPEGILWWALKLKRIKVEFV